MLLQFCSCWKLAAGLQIDDGEPDTAVTKWLCFDAVCGTAKLHKIDRQHE